MGVAGCGGWRGVGLGSVTCVGSELFMGPFCVTQSNPTRQPTNQPVSQPSNPLQVEKFGTNPTQPKTTNTGAYSLVVAYSYTQNLSVSGTGHIVRKIEFNCSMKKNLI